MRTHTLRGTSVISLTPPSPDALRALGLPAQVRACLFDLDGVLTQTATLHFAAWKHTFDELLADLGESEFTSADYAAHVDGRRRYDGVRTFLAARGIERERSEEHTSELQSRGHLVCRLLLEKKKKYRIKTNRSRYHT